MRNLRYALLAAVILLFGACTESGNSLSDPASSQISKEHTAESPSEAAAFLSRATFGATPEGIKKLYEEKISYEKWLDEQFSAPPTYHMEWALENVKGVGSTPDLKDAPEEWKRNSDTIGYLQRDIWWHIAVNAEDQLRQRTALALSEIFVISKYGPLATMPDARVSFYDLLVKDAFANFETLLEDVTFHPAMGRYLSYLGNAKADEDSGRHPDENYAREVMQLFTIGLYELNPDGTRRVDSDGKPIATYTQRDIREMARVFTGLTDRNGFFFADEGSTSHISRTVPMIAVEEYHDNGPKTVLGKTIPAGNGTKKDIEAALHILFMHKNTGPFIAKRLIQRLVTDNPSPGYIERVASIFDNNGSGVRGDMKSVVKAVLLDDEALNGAKNAPETFGKFREPLLFVTNLFRAFGAEGALNTLQIYDGGPAYRYRSFHFHGTGMTKQEAPLEALTVFNYFTPEGGPFSLKKEGLAAPELELYGKGGIDDVLMGLITENGFVYRLYEVTAELQIEREKAFIDRKEYRKLVDYLDSLLTGGVMSETAKEAIVSYLKAHEGTKDDDGNPLDSDKLARLAIGAVMTSPDYALQR